MVTINRGVSFLLTVSCLTAPVVDVLALLLKVDAVLPAFAVVIMTQSVSY